jgi:hypothetical protein
VSPGLLQSRITELIHSGRLTSRRGLLWGQPDCYVAGREQKVDTVSDQVAQLYREGKPHKEIGARVRLTENQVHHILSILFAAGLPKRERGLTDGQTREIHRSYMLGGSIEILAREAGFTGPTVRKRLRELGLSVGMKLVGAERRSVAGERGATPQQLGTSTVTDRRLDYLPQRMEKTTRRHRGRSLNDRAVREMAGTGMDCSL